MLWLWTLCHRLPNLGNHYDTPGKTTLIEKTIEQLGEQLRIAVIEGDPHTGLDSGRVQAMGAIAVQINTQSGCHLDAAMIRRALDSIDTSQVDLLFIENVATFSARPSGVWGSTSESSWQACRKGLISH